MRKYKWFIVPVVGNLFEWYEFAIFSSMSGPIGKVFFASDDAVKSATMAMMIYGVGLISRPFGTLLYGHIGDRYGRKNALSFSLLVTCFATLAIPLLPMLAGLVPLGGALIVARVLQGIGFGGEHSSVVTYTCEMAEPGKKGLLGAMQVCSVILAVFLGLLTMLILGRIYTEQDILAFAWKIPFYISIVLGLFGLYARINSSETQEFIDTKDNQELVSVPVLFFFKNYYVEFFICSSWIFYVSSLATVSTIGVKAILGPVFGIDAHVATLASIVICVTAVIVMIIFGIVVERFRSLYSFRKVFSIVSICVCLVAVFVLKYSPIIGMFAVAMVVAVFNASYPYYFYKKIPTKVRDTGIGLSIALPSVLGGGFGGVVFIKLFNGLGLWGIGIYFLVSNLVMVLGLMLDGYHKPRY